MQRAEAVLRCVLFALGALPIALVLGGCPGAQDERLPHLGPPPPENPLPGAVYSIAIETDGKILIGGDFDTCNGVPRPGVARLETDGSLDTGFLASGLGEDSVANALAVQSDGKIPIAGWLKAPGYVIGELHPSLGQVAGSTPMAR